MTYKQFLADWQNCTNPAVLLVLLRTYKASERALTWWLLEALLLAFPMRLWAEYKIANTYIALFERIRWWSVGGQEFSAAEVADITSKLCRVAFSNYTSPNHAMERFEKMFCGALIYALSTNESLFSVLLTLKNWSSDRITKDTENGWYYQTLPGQLKALLPLTREEIPEQDLVLMDQQLELKGYQPVFRVGATTFVRPLPEWLTFAEEEETTEPPL